MSLSNEQRMYRSVVLRILGVFTLGVLAGYVAKYPIASVMKHYDEPMSDNGDHFSVRRLIFNGVNLLSLIALCYKHVRHSCNAFEIDQPRFLLLNSGAPVGAAESSAQPFQLSRSAVLKWGTLPPIFLLTLVESNVLFTVSVFNDHMSWVGLGVVGATALMYVMTRCCVDEPRYSDKLASPSCMKGCC